MNNFHSYRTPEQLVAGSSSTLAELQRLAARKTRRCMNCDEKEWKLADCGLCFSCTTGEADASGDYEIVSTHAQDVAEAAAVEVQQKKKRRRRRKGSL
jgi:hypothetical protein